MRVEISITVLDSQNRRLEKTGVTSSSIATTPRPLAESQESFPVPRLTRLPGGELE
jgi:hypothetical protein